MGLSTSHCIKILPPMWNAVNPFPPWAFPPYATGTFPPTDTAFNSRPQLYNNKYNNISTMVEGTRSCYDIDIYNVILLLPTYNNIYTIIGGTRSRRNTFPPEHVHAGARSRRNSFTPEHVPAVPREPVPGASPERVPGGSAPTGDV